MSSNQPKCDTAATPITIDDLTATVMHTLFDIGQLRLDLTLPSDLPKMITVREPIKELVG